MKYNTLALSALLALTAPAQAAEIDCELLTKAARVTMQARQAGVPMEKMMDAAKTDIHRTMILESYDQPKYRTEPMQKEATNEFAAEFMGECYRFNQEFADD